MSKNGFGKFITGVGVGLGLGLLLAPKSGEETRKDLKEGALKLKDRVAEIDLNEVKRDLFNQYDRLKKEIKNMDSERAKEIAQEKANELALKANELYLSAKEKAEPYIEQAARDLKSKLSDLLENLQEKLDN